MTIVRLVSRLLELGRLLFLMRLHQTQQREYSHQCDLTSSETKLDFQKANTYTNAYDRAIARPKSKHEVPTAPKKDPNSNQIQTKTQT